MSFLWFLSEYRSPAADAFFQGVTWFGEEIFAIVVICFLYWCLSKKAALFLGFSYFSAGLVLQALKLTFRIERPWILDPDFKAVESALPKATGYSFPSGHTQSITSMMGSLALMAPKKWQKCICIVFLILVPFSRMYLGVHTPADVIVSFLVSMTCVVLCYCFIYKKENIQDNPLLIVLILLAVSIAVTVYAAILCSTYHIDPALSTDCFKATGAGMGFAVGYYLESRFIRFEIPKDLKVKILRFLIGVALSVLILKGLKPIIGESLPASCIRYCVTIIWVLAGYPAVFQKTEKRFLKAA